MSLRDDLLLYAVTDRTWVGNKTLAMQVEEALQGGVTMVQLREKNMSDEEFEKEALEIQAICRQYKVPLLINDNVMLAKKINADGVHVGQSDMDSGEVRKLLGPDKIIGVTAKTIEQAQKAMANGADYLGSGAVFGTTTKPDAKPMDLALFQEICRSVPIPVVAIGGVKACNVHKLEGSGAAGIAVVGGIFSGQNVKEASEELKKLAQKYLRKDYSTEL